LGDPICDREFLWIGRTKEQPDGISRKPFSQSTVLWVTKHSVNDIDRKAQRKIIDKVSATLEFQIF